MLCVDSIQHHCANLRPELGHQNESGWSEEKERSSGQAWFETIRQVDGNYHSKWTELAATPPSHRPSTLEHCRAVLSVISCTSYTPFTVWHLKDPISSSNLQLTILVWSLMLKKPTEKRFTFYHAGGRKASHQQWRIKQDVWYEPPYSQIILHMYLGEHPHWLILRTEPPSTTGHIKVKYLKYFCSSLFIFIKYNFIGISGFQICNKKHQTYWLKHTCSHQIVLFYYSLKKVEYFFFTSLISLHALSHIGWSTCPGEKPLTI